MEDPIAEQQARRSIEKEKPDSSEAGALLRPDASDEQAIFLKRIVGHDPAEIIPRLQQGDPLDLQTLCMRLLRERGLIFDPERALLKAQIEVAVQASLAQLEDLGPNWIQDSIDRAFDKLLSEDRELARNPSAHPALDDTPYRFVHHAFGAPIEECLQATVEFHALPHRARFAFFVLLVDNMTVDDVLAIGKWNPPEELRLDIWNTMRALGHVTREEVETFRTRKRRTQ